MRLSHMEIYYAWVSEDVWKMNVYIFPIPCKQCNGGKGMYEELKGRERPYDIYQVEEKNIKKYKVKRSVSS